MQFGSIRACNLKSFLVDEQTKQKYWIDDFPDSKFVEMFIKAIEVDDKSKKLENYNKLVEYVLEQMGGFDIDGWTLRTKV